MLDYRLEYFSYFGTEESTISGLEREAGMTSAYPSVLVGKSLPKATPDTTTIPFADVPELAIQGQGVVAVQIIPGNTFSITLQPNAQLKEGDTALELSLTDKSAKFLALTMKDGKVVETVVPSTFPKGESAATLTPGIEDLYWLSVDQKNGFIRYGKTYRSAAVTLVLAKVDIGDLETKPGPYIWIKKLKYVIVGSAQGGSSARPDLQQFSIGALPIVSDLPPVIAESIHLTLEDLAIGTVTSIANLNPACQRLYTNVTGPSIQLDDKNFPDFSDALEYSIRTPNKLCYNMLKSKEGEFGDPLMTYLRITLGLDEGNSPGVPYVMEIWPSKHKSPIHDHGEAYAVIKVLHGAINASYYSKLDAKTGIKLEPDVMLEKGNVTWIGPDNYQIHMLHNDFDRVCVTIQCYQYADADIGHDEYFEFLEAHTGEKKPFYPEADWEFMNFKKLIKAEWEAHLKETQW